jgi:hypothetical protein
LICRRDGQEKLEDRWKITLADHDIDAPIAQQINRRIIFRHPDGMKIGCCRHRR